MGRPLPGKDSRLFFLSEAPASQQRKGRSPFHEEGWCRRSLYEPKHALLNVTKRLCAFILPIRFYYGFFHRKQKQLPPYQGVSRCLLNRLARNFASPLDSIKIRIINLAKNSHRSVELLKSSKMVDQNRKLWVLGCCCWGFLTLSNNYHKKGGMNYDMEKNDRLSCMGLDESI
jgi:hypothetical protein